MTRTPHYTLQGEQGQACILICTQTHPAVCHGATTAEPHPTMRGCCTLDHTYDDQTQIAKACLHVHTRNQARAICWRLMQPCRHRGSCHSMSSNRVYHGVASAAVSMKGTHLLDAAASLACAACLHSQHQQGQGRKQHLRLRETRTHRAQSLSTPVGCTHPQGGGHATAHTHHT